MTEAHPEAGLRIVDEGRLRDKIARARLDGRPLFLLIIATKPCYVKLSPLVCEATKHGAPLVVVDTGHHFDEELVGAGRDFAIAPEVDIFLDVRGTMLERTAALALKCQSLADALRRLGASLDEAFPIVSGDTSTSATFPLFWYLQTGARCVHIEAGLRSRSPFLSNTPTRAQIREQRAVEWRLVPDEPFPEGVDTRVTSVVSRRLYAPLDLNRTELLREGYDDQNILVTGSLSADAVDAVCGTRPTGELAQRRVRIDVHRRENMTPSRLDAIVGAAEHLAGNGFQVSFVLTNQIKAAFSGTAGGSLRARLERAHVHCDPITPSYVTFLNRLATGAYGVLLTDSGGLQEESAILDIPCCILRYSTDRPETVCAFGTAVLAPPAGSAAIVDTMEWFLGTRRARVLRPYGELVSTRILADLGHGPLHGDTCEAAPRAACVA